MPITSLKTPKYNPPRESIITWDTWRKGLNLLLRENELEGSEMTQAENLLLTGSGVPTKRWGSQNYFMAGPTGSTTSIGVIKDSSENIQVLALTDTGLLTKKSGSSYTNIVGASWPSGSKIQYTQLGGNAYIVSNNRELVKYNFTNLISFATISAPTSLLATTLSTASGPRLWSWRVTGVGRSGGETTGSVPISLPTLPQDLSQTVIRLNWAPISAASGDLVGYNIYRGSSGNEKWIGGTDYNVTSFDDVGNDTPDAFRTVPLENTTGGPRAKYVIRYQDRLIFAGIAGAPTKVLISGRWPDHERFDWYAGGGDVEIEPDSGQHITGLGIYQEKLVVFKENSVWELQLSYIQTGDYYILNPTYKLLTASQGCSSHRSIIPVENDLMFSNRRGIYILRYEPQLLTVINANEISAKIRPFFESLSDADLTSASGIYHDKKYILSFPNSKQSIIFDRERLSFYGPWKTPFGIADWEKYVDENGMDRIIAADSSDNYVTEFSSNYLDDKNTPIRTIFRSKREDFKDWTLMKTINEVYMSFRAIRGDISVNIYIENRTGNIITAKSFTISGSEVAGNSGFGIDGFGITQFGTSQGTPSAAKFDYQKHAFIYKSSRIFQIEIRTLGNSDNYELLGVKTIAIPQSRGNSPSSWNVS